MEAATVHQLHPSGEIPPNAPATYAEALARIAELEAAAANDYARRDAEDKAEGYRVTCEKQAREIGALNRRITEEEDPNHHPKGAEIVALIERWMRGSGHTKSKVSADRVKLVKARLRDEYAVEQLELAIDGVCSFPFVVNAQRKTEGKPSQRFDQLSHALKSGEHVERFAVMGHEARKAGLVTWGEES